MEKYILSDSFLAYMREKFPYDLYEDDYALFEKSIEAKESIIVNETKRNFNFTLQNDEDIDYFNSKFSDSYIPEIKTLQKLSEIIKNNDLFKFVEREINYGTPTPIPFIIATALVKNIPIVVDESDKDMFKYKKLAEFYNISLLTKNSYIKELRNA